MAKSPGKIYAQLLVSTRAQLEALGFDWGDVASEIGFDPKVTDDPEGVASSEVYLEIHEYLARVTGNDAIGVTLGSQVPVGTVKVFDYVALTAPTIAQSLENWRRFERILSNITQSSLSDENGKRYLSLQISNLYGPRTQLTAKAMSFAASRIRHMLGGMEVELSFDFTQVRPREIETYRRILGRNIRFGCEEDRIGIPLEVMNVAPLGAEENLYQLVEKTALARLSGKHIEENHLDNISRAINEALKEGDPSLETVARKMAMSKRALQRKMEENGQTFRQAVDRVRKVLAEQYLKEGKLQLSEIAYLLGYSELSTFSRAAKTWFGVSPKAYRRGETAPAASSPRPALRAGGA
ncbi:AraC family transcriptional regulator [Roseibium aggregatum]|uniref:Helix-turn-helix domain-containing protein n=1 Tax=Roseibium aggregatum TaxID=187304 RepID=A0A926S890_9HYPH|nr:AraC family transcriptional regulator [Roseibium aggregatum]MBD1544644.1 helix-turn-helix domain-containing protein [Roseibium aggregatum]